MPDHPAIRRRPLGGTGELAVLVVGYAVILILGFIGLVLVLYDS